MRVSTTAVLAVFAATSTAMVLPGPTGTPAAVPAASPVQNPTEVTPTAYPLVSLPKWTSPQGSEEVGDDPENSLERVCGAEHKECGLSGCCHSSSACVVQKGKGFCVRHDFLRLAKKGLLRKRQSEFDYDAFFSSASASYSYSYDYDTTPSYSIDYMSDYMDSFSSILDEYTNNLNSFSSFDYDSYYTSLLASLTANNPALESLFLTDNSPYQGSYYSSISNALKSSLDAVATATGSVKPTSTSSGSSSGSKEDGGSGMSKTAIIGIVVAVVILVIAALIGWCVWRRRHPKTPKPKLEVLQTGPGHVPIPGPGPQVPISNGPDASALPGKDGSFYAPPGPPQPPVSPPPTVHSPPPPIYPNNKTELDGGSTLAPNAAGNVPSRHPTPTPPIHGVFETEARPWSVPPVAPSATGTVTSGTTLAHNPSTVSSMTRSSHGEVYSPGQAMYGRVHEAGGHEIPAHQQPPRQPERDRPMQAPYEPQGPIFEMGDQR